MKSFVIPKDKVKNLNVEIPFREEFRSSSDFIDYLVERGYTRTEEEKHQLHKFLDQYFLNRSDKIEREKKFLDFFADDVKKNRRIKLSQKFVDFLILKNIAGAKPRKHSSIVEPQESSEIQPLEKIAETKSKGVKELQPNPSFIYNSEGEIIGVQILCSCGDTIRIDFEFEGD